MGIKTSVFYTFIVLKLLISGQLPRITLIAFIYLNYELSYI
ncbi:hypothetical protein CZ797_17125 [Pseudoalteromonas sp. JB197]|nr:hypothetical protein CZ797_17125 [Pseudoalteromonas sp. JB197]